jgi:kynureninase
LYVRPDLHETLEPRLVGWQGDRAPFDFRSGPIEYASGIWRFLSGTPNIPALYGARAGYRIVQEAGIEAIREKSLRMTQAIINMADELEIPVNSERSPGLRGGTVTLDVGDEDRVSAALGDRHVIVDARPGAGIRVGPHFYNSDEDLARLREGLIEILKR